MRFRFRTGFWFVIRTSSYAPVRSDMVPGISGYPATHRINMVCQMPQDVGCGRVPCHLHW